jgi:hypothetical protein
MAVLSDEARADTVQQFIRRFFVSLAMTADLSTTEVRTLINDLDAWLDSQTTEANNSITATIRTKASTNTKFAALAYVALKRGNVI